MQKNLWITISSNTTMDRHVTNICRSTYGELRRISSIRHPLTVNATQTLLSAFVLSKSLLQLLPLWLTSIHSGQAPMSMKFCSKISHEIPQVWSCTTSFAQPSLVTSPLKDWLQDFNPVLQHFLQLFSFLCCSTLLPDTSIYPWTHAPSIFLSSELSHFVKEHSASQAQLNRIYCLMDSNTLNVLLH